ncbi:MAG: hypothetical protein ACD_23C00643G0001 [uncultured bacterium]|nr:MAG: hypothetical protein ACD_23C00643G0001 [uncultured bacterium]
MTSSTRVKSYPAPDLKCRVRSSSGITSSLQTMVETAIVSTITMPVAADKPPMNANKASAGCPAARGNDRTKLSAFICPDPKYNKPPRAIGRTNRLMASR